MPSYATPFGPLPFTTADAERLALRRDGDLRRLSRLGLVRRVARGVYVDAAVPDSLHLRAAAVGLVVPPGSAVCGRTAAWLWGVDALAMGAHRELPAVDVMALPGANASRRCGVFGSSGPLLDSDVVSLGGTLVTTPARTAADLARLLRRPDALASLDAMLQVPGLTPDDIRAVLDRFARHRGVVQARELVVIADPRAESPQERRARLRCIDAGIPAPEPQIEVFDSWGEFVARLDMGWRELLRGVEFDGAEHHSTREQVRHDRLRLRRVESCGWQVVAVTSEHVQGRSLVFEYAICELTGFEPRLTRHHPRYGGWDARGRWSA